MTISLGIDQVSEKLETGSLEKRHEILLGGPNLSAKSLDFFCGAGGDLPERPKFAGDG
jgi:hypothetical protein